MGNTPPVKRNPVGGRRAERLLPALLGVELSLLHPRGGPDRRRGDGRAGENYGDTD